MPQSFARINIHIVFSTKNRRPMIALEWEDRLCGVIGGSLRTVKSTLLCAGGIEDHVHLLISLARDLSVSDAVRDIKTDSSKWVHNKFGMSEFQWQRGYSAFSVSHSQLGSVRTYFAGQKEHHRKQTYQDEVRQLLRLHEIEPDEEHMWD
jgi:REP element-mobilizing transposase RayT